MLSQSLYVRKRVALAEFFTKMSTDKQKTSN